MRFRTKLAIFAAKCSSRMIHILKRGNGLTLPGRIAYLFDHDILSEMAQMIKEKVIVVMGTNGKTTTNALIFHAITGAGKTAVINRTGSNMLNGIISAFVLQTGKGGRIDADYACIEVDENASKNVLSMLDPDCILLTNISRDQLDRFGEVDLTFQTIKNAFASVPNAKLVINCDDIISYNAALDCPNEYTTYGISEPVFDDTARSEIMESIFCRKCGSKLEYRFFHYGQLGVYHCPHCGFKRPVPDLQAESIEKTGSGYNLMIGGKQIRANTPNTYQLYNILAAQAVLNTAGICDIAFSDAVASFDFGNRREDTFKIGEMNVSLNLAKNPIGFQQKVSYVLKDDSPKDVIILINDDFQDGRDVSWLWDVDFQYLSNANARSIYTTGSRRYDMALRLKYDGIPCEVTEDLKNTVLWLSRNGTGNLYLIVNYTALYSTHDLLAELEKNPPSDIQKPDSDHIPVIADTGKEEVSNNSTDIRKEKYRLTIGHLYPDLLNLYGDRGNIRCMQRRLQWRGIESEVIRVESGERPCFDRFDIVLLGGGSDREQELVCGFLKEIKEDFIRYIEEGGVVLAVCGGYQLLGRYYKTESSTIEGIGALDYYTEWEKQRLVDNIVLKSVRYELPVTGFENHGGRTYIGNAQCFGKVLYGYGNTGDKTAEGVVYKNVIATYLHGPLLPKNPEVCDDLLKRALKKRYPDEFDRIRFDDLNDEAEKKANNIIVHRYCKQI